jgi:uncharacterized protein (DUF885 family)
VNQQIADLADRYWDVLMAYAPTWASIIGDHRFDTEMEDMSREREDALIDDLEGLVGAAAGIEPEDFDRDDRITRAVLLSEAEGQIAMARTRSAEFLVDPMLGPHIEMIQTMAQLTPTDTAQADAFVEKASKVGLTFDTALDRLRDGLAAGRTPPRISIERSLHQIDAYLASPVESDVWLQIQPPEGMPDGAVTRWREAMAAQVREIVRPAVQRYGEFVRTEVLPAGRPPEKSGVCWLPDGDAVYAAGVRHYTTLDLDPDEVHRIGLDEIAILEDEYRTMAAPLLGTDDTSEIYQRLRTDPELRFDTPEQVREQAERALARAQETSPGWFGLLPEAPCVVVPIPDIGAAESTIAYYLPPAGDGSRPGMFFINLSEPTTRTRFESEALAFHESVPGHHLQLALAQEMDLPTFRRNGIVTSYVEGWGLYTERLSDEMGLYSGGVERLGMLSFDSWRAGRLVVDTGLHHKGWSRQQAIDYLVENSPQAVNNMTNEVDRYIGYFGQALAYKMGQRTIVAARQRAEQTMGDRFDIKGFHDAVLKDGPVPLDLLGELVEEWAAAGPT